MAYEINNMFNIFKRNTQLQNASMSGHDNLFDTFIHMQQSVNELPVLDAFEKVQLDHDIAISHLYHSSKIEGTTLNEKRLRKAIDA